MCVAFEFIFIKLPSLKSHVEERIVSVIGMLDKLVKLTTLPSHTFGELNWIIGKGWTTVFLTTVSLHPSKEIATRLTENELAFE